MPCNSINQMLKLKEGPNDKRGMILMYKIGIFLSPSSAEYILCFSSNVSGILSFFKPLWVEKCTL